MSDDSSIPPQKCPKCGHNFDSATCVAGHHTPKPGMVSLCLYCGDVHIFDEALHLIRPDETLLAQINADPMVMHAQILIAGRNGKK